MRRLLRMVFGTRSTPVRSAASIDVKACSHEKVGGVLLKTKIAYSLTAGALTSRQKSGNLLLLVKYEGTELFSRELVKV